MENSKLKSEEQQLNEDKSGNWVGGVILIAVGLFFLLGNLVPNFGFNNWWAFFILIPVIAMWGKAWKTYRQTGQLGKEGRQEITGALFPLFVALIFLFNWNWGQVWPGFIIIAGLNALVGGYFD